MPWSTGQRNNLLSLLLLGNGTSLLRETPKAPCSVSSSSQCVPDLIGLLERFSLIGIIILIPIYFQALYANAY